MNGDHVANPPVFYGTVGVTGAAFFGGHPKGIQLPMREAETEFDRLAAERRTVGSASPRDGLEGSIRADRLAVLERERSDDSTGGIEDLRPKFALRRGDIHEEVAPTE